MKCNEQKERDFQIENPFLFVTISNFLNAALLP